MFYVARFAISFLRLANTASCARVGRPRSSNTALLPDPDDRHVLAAAIRAVARAILTFNLNDLLNDLPANRLASYSIDATHPDDFGIDTIALSPGAVAKVIGEQAGALQIPPRSIPDLLNTLRGQGLVRSVVKLRELFGPRDP